MTTQRTDWFKDARWGVFCHYLAEVSHTDHGTGFSAEDWNRQVDAFDVPGLADQLASIGAPYFCITLGQNSGHYCAPNAAYDRHVGISPSKCARRDLVSDLYDALQPHGISPLVYLPSGAPAADPLAMERLQWQWGFTGGWPEAWNTTRTGERLAAFQLRWEEVIREWSLRWGTKVRGWWFDGCYFADEMYRHADQPNFASFAAAARAGNPDSLVAFNPGVLYPIITMTEQEDYTAGEINELEQVDCTGRWVEHAQYHMLSYLGPSWCAAPPRFTDEQVIAYTRRITDHDGVVTWDVPIQVDGHIPQPFFAQLCTLGRAMRTVK